MLKYINIHPKYKAHAYTHLPEPSSLVRTTRSCSGTILYPLHHTSCPCCRTPVRVRTRTNNSALCTASHKLPLLQNSCVRENTHTQTTALNAPHYTCCPCCRTPVCVRKHTQTTALNAPHYTSCACRRCKCGRSNTHTHTNKSVRALACAYV
jgi:hypothetical protein